MSKSRIGDYLSYGLTGAALGTGTGALFNSAAHGEQKPLAILAGAGLGAGAGTLLAYMRHKDSVNPSKLEPGWYVFQRPLKNLPDLGVYVRHSGNMIVLPREQAETLLDKEGWKRTSHKNFTGKGGQKLTAFVFDGTSGDESPFSIFGGSPIDVSFRSAKETFDMPLTDIAKVPLKNKVSLLDAMQRLRQIDNIYSVLGGPSYQLFPGADQAKSNTAPTNSHGITVNILKDTEDLHNLKEWSPSGAAAVKYLREEARPEALQAIIDKQYLPEMLRAGTAGGVMGGVLLGGTGGMYGSYEVNKRLDPTAEKLKNIQTIGSLGLVGALGGSLIGMAGRGIQLAMEKNKAKKELANLKTAAVQDYAVHGIGGAAIGTAAGALGNVALGRDMLDHRLLLGGMGVGAAAGLFSGHIRSKEREQQEKSAQSVKLSYRLDEHGKPITINGEYVPRNGTYIVVRPLGYGSMPKAFTEDNPTYMNNAGHSFYVTFTDKPVTTAHNLEDGGHVVFKSVKYLDDDKRPIYAFYHQLDNDSKTPGRSYKFTSRASINDTYVTPENLKAFSSKKHRPELFQGNYNDVVRKIFNPDSTDPYSQYGRLIALQYDDDVDSAVAHLNATKRIAALNSRFLKNNGELGRYTLVSTPWHKLTGTTNNCLTFLVYLTRALERKKLLNTMNTRHLIPKYLGVAFSANTQNPDAYNKVFGDFD